MAFPIRHRVLIKGKVIVMLIAAVWIASWAMPVLKLLYGRERNYEIYKYGFSKAVIVFSAVFHAFTYYRLKKQSRSIALQNSSDTRAQELRIQKEKQFLKTIILIACIAFACTVPSLVFFQFHSSLTSRTDNLEKILRQIFMCFFAMNFVVNPFIYVVRLPNYRKTFRILYCNKRGS